MNQVQNYSNINDGIADSSINIYGVSINHFHVKIDAFARMYLLLSLLR